MRHSFATNLCLSVVSDDVEIKHWNMPPNPLPTVNSEYCARSTFLKNSR